MKKTIRIGLLFICCFMNISLSYASPQNLDDLQSGGNLLRCQDCRQAKCWDHNPKCDRCPPCPPGPQGLTITRLFAYGGAYNNGTTLDDLLVRIDETFRYTVFSTNQRVTFNPDREITIDVTGDYLIKFIASINETLLSFPVFVGLRLNGVEVVPSFFTVSVPGSGEEDEERVNAYILKGQVILPLTAGDQLELFVSPIGVPAFLHTSAGDQPSLNTSLSVEKLN